jgi:C-terminal processing protease CtpA/Prc
MPGKITLLPLVFAFFSISGTGSAQTVIDSASTALSEPLSPEKIEQLADFGRIWGFLKYYHPAVTAGKYDWDAVYFRYMPAIIREKGDKVNELEEKLIDDLGEVPPCSPCAVLDKSKLKLLADSAIFLNERFPAGLRKKLLQIKDKRPNRVENYYVKLVPKVGNPIFQHEKDYPGGPYPATAVRMLALFRFWSMVEYFYPYRYLIRDDWNGILEKFIPRMIAAADKFQYVAAFSELIADIHDTHANIYPPNTALDTLKGVNILPVSTRFIGDSLVVTGYYVDSPALRNLLHVGDVIQRIDGVPVDMLIKKYLPLTAASNYVTQLRQLASGYGFLPRSNSIPVKLSILRETKTFELTINRILLASIKLSPPPKPAFEFLRPEIGYINPGKLTDRSVDSVKEAFQHTKGIIIDLRYYPGAFLPFKFGEWLKPGFSPFAYFSAGSLELPGNFFATAPVSNGPTSSRSVHNGFQGKIVLIVNSSTQSSGEYTAMALSTAPAAIVIGSTTAGADGNVSTIALPGGISTMFSGIGVYYPDSRETQGVGIKVDVPVKQTIRGIREGRDELLEKAIGLIETGAP